VVSKNRNASQTNNDDGTGNSLTILVVHTDPAAPAIVGTLTDARNLFGAYGVVASGTHAYVASQGCLTGQSCPDKTVGNAFAVIDVANPAAPALGAVLHNNALPAPWAGTGALSHVTSVAVSGSYAYVTASYSDRLTVIDIANPAAPTIVASLRDTTNLDFPVDVQVRGQFAYVADQGTNPSHPQLTVVNVANPASPAIAGSLTDPLQGGAYRVALSGPFAYIAGSSSTAVSAIDVSNPAAPVLDGSVYDPTAFWHTTGLALDTTGHLVVSSPDLKSQPFQIYPPFPGQPGTPRRPGRSPWSRSTR